MRFLSLLIAIATVFGCSACGGAGSGGGESTPTKPRPTQIVTLSARTHHPLAGAPWPIVIVARRAAGAPLRATVHYQFLFAGSVVARRSHYRFDGTLHDVLRWPANSEGVPLTFRAIVTTALGTRRLDYPVQVKH